MITPTFHGNFTTSNHFRGLCQSYDGHVVAVPYSASGGNGIQKINPYVSPMTFENISVESLFSGSGEAWLSCSLAPNGKILMSTWRQPNLLVLDTNNWSLTGINGGSIGWWQQRSTCTGNDGDWWTAPWASSLVRKVNSTTNAITNFSVHYQNHTHPAAQTIADVTTNRNTQATLYNRYWGIVPSHTPKMFGIPFTAERVLVIDPTRSGAPGDPIAYEASTLLTGNYYNENLDSQWYFPNGNLISATSIATPAQKYTSGTFDPINREIICFPRRGQSLLIIKPDLCPAYGETAHPDFAVELPLPSGPDRLNFEIFGGGNSNYFGSGTLANGHIIGVPWQNYACPVWDPYTRSVYWKVFDELRPENVLNNLSASINMFTSALLMEDGRTIFCPFSAGKFMTLSVGEDKTLSRDATTQRWINRSM